MELFYNFQEGKSLLKGTKTERDVPMPFWDFLCGRIPTIVVRVNALPVPKDFIGKDYEQDEAFREKFQKWINGLWENKDRRIEKIMKQQEAGK